MYFWHADAIGAVHELGGRGDAERGAREGEHLAVAEQRYAVGEIEVRVLVDGGQVTSLPGVRIALVQQHDGHAAVVGPLENRAQIERVAEQEVGVSVTVANVELYGNLLPRRPCERHVQKRVEQGLVNEPRVACFCIALVFSERALRILPWPLPYIQARPVGGY